MTKKIRYNLEDVTILGGSYRNFAGETDKFNRNGDKFFHIFVPEEYVDDMIADGFNLKGRPDYDDEEKTNYLLKIKIGRNAVVHTYGGNKRVSYSSDENMSSLDWNDIDHADISIMGSSWEMNDAVGTSAYLTVAHLVIDVDPHASKYGEYDDDGNLIVNDPFAPNTSME